MDFTKVDAVQVACRTTTLYVSAMYQQRAESPLRLNGLAAAHRFFAECMAETDPGTEHLWVAHVDDRARCIHLSRHDGDEGGATLPLRQVTRRFVLAGEAIDLTVLDHLVIAGQECSSMRAMGLL